MTSASSPGSANRLIIALDFGTTYSGIAYAFSNDKVGLPVSIDNWPGEEGRRPVKIPTLAYYDSSDSSKFSWGAKAGASASRVAAVKLLLDPSQPRPKYLPDLDAEVPAVWSDAAKNATLQAAELAGLNPVHLIKEPEAAALWTTKQLDIALLPDDAFVVCDAGGGTVDLISYQVEETLPHIRVKELVPGTGGLAGSLGLNQRFDDAVRRLVGKEQWRVLQSSKGYNYAAKYFDRDVKRNFMNREDDEYFVSFPMAKLRNDPDRGLESNCWAMAREDTKVIFDPIIQEVLSLIEGQVEGAKAKLGGKSPKYIFLVGGFGASLYLLQRVVEKYPDIQVLQPPEAWAAIAKGAALYKMSNRAIVTSSSATRHYGVSTWGLYDESRDRGQPTLPFKDDTIRTEIMQWYINIGDDLLRHRQIKFPFCRKLDEGYTSDGLRFTDHLYECENDPAPVHPLKVGTFRINCTITSDFSGAPRDKFVKKTNKCGQVYYELSYDLVLTLDGALMKLSLEMDGQSYGSVEAKYHI
ncbi:uncharacterized protein TrAtP1_008294 [Trichoderma atroviride]|uniref:uncharacterized protein n=1 Tax=Hypocrea atroviridis TaxID=63577 RepID=UPI003323EBDF|nr:hypothetical protein TrAtP1_008294 [Trichoderma atroviride]